MLVNGQRFLRNTYYQITQRRANTDALLFEVLYKRNPSAFSWISVLEAKRSIYLVLDFLSPELQAYKGLEIAVFSPNQLACYWLPGANTKAFGSVAPGNYSVCLKVLNEKRLTVLHLQKTKDNFIQRLPNSPLDTKKCIYLPCNLLSYSLFQSELEALINHGQS